jgi:ABC-type hemin transport system substrate-binding protein
MTPLKKVFGENFSENFEKVFFLEWQKQTSSVTLANASRPASCLHRDTMALKRVVSLLPAATEILALIGGSKMLVGRSHECDYPENLKDVPVLTASKLSFSTSLQVDTEVR